MQFTGLDNNYLFPFNAVVSQSFATNQTAPWTIPPDLPSGGIVQGGCLVYGK